MAGNLCGSGVNQAIPARIGSAASKACVKFPTREGTQLFRQGQGTFVIPAGNSQVRAGNAIKVSSRPDAPQLLSLNSHAGVGLELLPERDCEERTHPSSGGRNSRARLGSTGR